MHTRRKLEDRALRKMWAPGGLSRRTVHVLILLVGVLVATATMNSALGRWAERSLDPMRVAAWSRPASKRIVIVEMDAASVAAIDRWPWPRDQHAAVVDRLRRAGAASITFDVDLSTPSTRAGDIAFAAALRRADGLVALPTFAQQARTGDARLIDTVPLPAFRDHASLASVSMLPDDDGIVRRAPFGTVTGGMPRPSLSAHMAQRSGSADDFFPIDFGIDPATIPHLSFVAVRDGRFDPAIVRGRDIVIGATAIEMGDRYATPYWGVIAGVVVQAMAAETLLQAVPVEGTAFAAVFAAVLLGALILRARRTAPAVALGVAAPVMLFAGVVFAQAAWHRIYPLAPALALLGIVAAGRIALGMTARLEEQKAIDEETGLPTRHVMVRDIAATSTDRVAVASIGNVDSLLTVLGQDAGRDLVLRLCDRIRLVEGVGTIYRLSDRLLAFPLASARDLDDTFAILRALLLQPVEVAGRRVDAAVHIGVADTGAPVEQLIASATRAADEAAGAGAFWRSGSVDMAALEQQVSLMAELDEALAAGEIEVHYQPKIDLAQGRVTSVEALVRWRHPIRGMVPPDAFIPLAEKTDRIAALTLFVLGRTITDLATWHQAGLALTAAVNMSATLVSDARFGVKVHDLLTDGTVPPSSIILEVTESATLSDPDRAAAALRAYRAMGVAISMDDYGTGQSTLSYLKRLPLSELKIDRSFVQHAHLNREDAAMVRSTVDLAHELGIKVVAEGVEDAECLNFLKASGCDMAQGYFISRPVPAAVLVADLLARRDAA